MDIYVYIYIHLHLVVLKQGGCLVTKICLVYPYSDKDYADPKTI